jgi:hypothetical protein
MLKRIVDIGNMLIGAEINIPVVEIALNINKL